MNDPRVDKTLEKAAEFNREAICQCLAVNFKNPLAVAKNIEILVKLTKDRQDFLRQSGYDCSLETNLLAEVEGKE